MSAVVTANPATGEQLAEYAVFTDADIDDALSRADEAQRSWAALPVGERATVLRRMAAILRDEAADLALLVTREMGKPLAESRAEVDKCATTCDFYADNAEALLADEPVETSADASWISYEPVGVVLAVMPWNFPLWQVVRFAAPALMAGNAALLEHAPNTPGCAVAVQRIVAAAGAPEGLFGALVLADADLPRVAALAARGRLLNAGQSCISPKRLIVDASVAEVFTRLLVAEVEALVVGNPEAPGTDAGPMARADLRDGVHRQVQDSVAAGARLLVGGSPLSGPGCFFAPTVLTDVVPGVPAYDQEIFGPVAAVLVARDEDDAVRLANDTRFGLGASVWTRNPQRGVAVARRIRSGAAFVNALVASDPRMPFGGTRPSGYGRELAAAGIREFVDVRTWWVLDVPAATAPASE